MFACTAIPIFILDLVWTQEGDLIAVRSGLCNTDCVLQRIDLENFRCFRRARVELGPLTVLVGPNASGKSAILSALHATAEFGQDDVWRRTPGLSSSRIVWRDRVDCALPSNAYAYQMLRLDLNEARKPNVLQAQSMLWPNGGNLANMIASLGRKQQEALAKQLAAVVPAIADIDTRPVEGGTVRVIFQDRWKSDLWYAPADVSDGTMLMLAYLVLQYQSHPVDLVAIEEPERGLHPYLLGHLISHLRGLTDGTIGPRKLQIVMATHSAELLDYLRPEEVRFLRRRSDDGSTEVETAATDTPELRAAYDEYQQSLGSIWLSGSLGGVPGGSMS